MPSEPSEASPSSPIASMVAALCERYALGHPDIDAQHRRMFEIVAQADEDKSAAAIVDELHVYAAQHFAEEEGIATAHNVDIAEHRAAHQALLARIMAYRNADGEISQQVRRFLVDWVTHHIDREDRDLVRSIQAGSRIQRRTGA